MDTIYYNGHEYHKTYDHEAGGTYFESYTAEVVTSLLDVYPDGTVKGVWNERPFHIGKLVRNQVIEG